MKRSLLNAGRLPPALLARLDAQYAMQALPPPGAGRETFLAAHAASFEAAVTSAATGMDAGLIDALPALRVISSFGVGLDRIALDAAQRRGIAVGYTPDVLNDCVADLGFALLLDVARQVAASDRFVRRGEWTRGAYPLARKVSGAKLGLLGLGRIGRTIAQRASGFAMDVRYHSRRIVDGVLYRHEPSLVELARWCDFLVVITAGGAATRHLVNAEVLAALGPDGFVINVARGSVIDEAALLAALQQGRIGGAGLDVFEDEPRVPEAFFALDNVVLTPHIASATRETRQAMVDLVYDNLDAFFARGTLVAAAA